MIAFKQPTYPGALETLLQGSPRGEVCVCVLGLDGDGVSWLLCVVLASDCLVGVGTKAVLRL